VKMAEAGGQDCETQKNEISSLLKTPLKKGDTWYLIDTKWFKQWKRYVGFDSWDTSCVGDQSAYPGNIDNTPLFKEDTADQLKDHLIDELDYVLVPDEAWLKFETWYGTVDGQEPIARKVIEQGMFVKHCKVEVYMMDLKLCENEHMDNVITKQFSRADTIENIEKEMRKVFQVDDSKEVRLWNKYMSNTYEHLGKPDNTVQDAGLFQGQVIVIEQKGDDGNWPRQTKTTNSALHNLEIDSYTSSPARSGTSYNSYSSGYGSSSSYYNYEYRGTSSPGLCGLSNLGNTCFMNSALQCMSNVPELTEYFISEGWKDELNFDNPLGMKGEIATSYAELIRNIWSGKYSYTVPRNFKIAVGRFAPQFSGYQQQDSQELMAFLLDGLHEDLNRIKKKPYIEKKDDDGRPDEEVAKEAWAVYKKRNDSVIVDTFHGLIKSTLVCPECNKVSVTFDPICYLSLPLPIKKERQIEITFKPFESHRKSKHYKLTVPKLGVVADLCKALSKLTQIHPDKMVVTDVYNNRFHKVFSADENLNHILDKDVIFIYEVPVTSGDDPETLILPVYMREKRINRNNSHHVTSQLFGQPLLVPVPRKNCTYQMLCSAILKRTERYVRVPDDNEDWWKTDNTEKINNRQMNGEVEMNNDEDDSSDESPTTNKTSSSAATDDTDELEDDTVNEDDLKPQMFTIHLVNSFGSTEVDGIREDGRPIKFPARPYAAVDWHPKAKELFYDEKKAEDVDQDDSVRQRPVQRKQVVQLSECLELFTTKEKLGEHDPWYCPRCEKHQQATKKFDLWQLPKVLVIHLKRFSYSRYWRDKLDTFVEYPTKGLNMRKYVINTRHGPANYDLIAVSNHYGGMGGGHYTAYAKNKEDNQWYHFDDSSVSQTTEDSVVTKAGYVLVYQLQEPGQVNDQGRPRRPVVAASGRAASPNRDLIVNNGEHSSEDDMDIN